jgi:preprotein translocase subunit SecF
MSRLGRLNRGETNIDFLKVWKRTLIFSGVLVIISILSLFTRGLNLGIDFEGGVSWEVSAPGVSVSEARSALESVGEGSAKIQIVGSDIVRVQGPEATPEHEAEVRQELADLAGTDIGNVSVSTVGASWGSDITRSAIRALVFFFIAILIYLSVRLEWRMAVAAIVAVFHDVLISVGVYSVFQFEVTPGTVIAFLTILGYSIYDTIVVDDKIKENERLVGMSGRMTYGQMTSLSMNQVLLRSLNTSIVSIIPVIALLVVGAGIMGAVTLEEFSIALVVGLVVGAYSSIGVAAPALVWLKEREPKNRTIRERLAAQGVDVLHNAPRPTGRQLLESEDTYRKQPNPGSLDPDADAEAATEPIVDRGPDGAPTEAKAPAPPRPAGPTPSGAIPPRPRKKGRKR